MLTNTGELPVDISSVAVTGDFADQHVRCIDRAWRQLQPHRHVHAHAEPHELTITGTTNGLAHTLTLPLTIN